MYKLIVEVQSNSELSKKGWKKAVLTKGTKKHCQEVANKCGLKYEIVKIK
jgi:hypothetical protein